MLAGVRAKSIVPFALSYHIHHPTTAAPWGAGANIALLSRKNVPAFCENGLLKPGRRVARGSKRSPQASD